MAVTPALILALNPSIDAEWRVDGVRWEEKNAVQSERRWAGGKGINVARWLKHLGGEPCLILPLGGTTGEELAGFLRAEKLPAHILPLREPTRVNVIVTTSAGRQLRFNPPGPRLSHTRWSAVLKSVERNLKRMRVSQGRARHSVRAVVQPAQNGAHGVTRPTALLVLSGSLPRRVPVTAYAQLIRLAHRFGARTILDCDGPAFAAAIKAGPFLVKPNQHELAQWWGRALSSEAGVLRAARALSRETRGWVLVSRGAKRSLLINEPEQFQKFASPPRVETVNTVGAGDALLAAVTHCIQRGRPPEEWLAAGMQAGSVAVRIPAGALN